MFYPTGKSISQLVWTKNSGLKGPVPELCVFPATAR
jgi:hypothetical protein